jgi:hypothetical protein
MSDRTVYLTPSEFASSLLVLSKGIDEQGNQIDQSYDFESMPFLKPIWDAGYTEMVLVFGRQTGKTATEAGMGLTSCGARPGITVLYGVPDDDKVRQFHHQKLDPLLNLSKVYRHRYFSGKGVVNNVYEKHFTNGSMYFLRNAAHAGNFRGVTADILQLDEIQDSQTEVLDIAEHCLFTSQIKMTMLSGTPLSLSNTVEGYWQDSTMNEWLLPCPACASTEMIGSVVVQSHHWNNIGMQNVTPDGLICSKCGARLDRTKGQWVSFNPGSYRQGFRVPQPLSKFADFPKIYRQIQTRPIATVMNEIFALSYDSANTFFAQQDLLDAQGEFDIYHSMNKIPEDLKRIMQSRPIVAGIDWATQRESGAFTAMVLYLLVTPAEAWPIYMYRIPKTMSWDDSTDYIAKKLKEFRVSFVVADWGASGNRNSELAKVIGRDRIIQCEFVQGVMTVFKYVGDLRLMHINRTPALADFRTDVINGKVRMPKWGTFADYAKDLLVERVEEDSMGRVKFDHPKGSNDDILLAMVYANLAWKLFTNQSIVDLVVNAEEGK